MTGNLQERQQAIATLTEIIQNIEVAMLTTTMPDGSLRSRPMVSAEPVFNGELWFFTKLRAPKVDEVQQNGQVNVSFASPTEHRYVSLSGPAEVIRDQRKAEILWDPKYAAWFPDEAEPKQLGFLKVTIERAEYWDASTTRVVQIAGFAKSLFGGRRTQPAEHAKLEWPLTQPPVEQPPHFPAP